MEAVITSKSRLLCCIVEISEQFVKIFLPQMDIFFRFRFISGILLPKVKTTFGNRMLFKLFNLKVKLQTGCFQESDEIKILTLESSSD